MERRLTVILAAEMIDLEIAAYGGRFGWKEWQQ